MDYKNILGYLATIIALGSYAAYFYTIYLGKTKPHAFTWFVWGTLNIVGFTAVTASNGGVGAWILGVNVLACYTIAGIAFSQKRVEYDFFDWLALFGAFAGMILWKLTSNPLYAIILISLSDTIGFIPTYRKAFRLPYEENVTSYAIGLSYYVLALFSLTSFTLTTSLYQFVIVIFDAAFVIMVLIRRRQLAK